MGYPSKHAVCIVRSFVGVALAAAAMSMITGCSTDAPSAPKIENDPATVFQTFALDDHFILLGPDAPYDTATIRGVAYSATGVPLPGAVTTTYASTDESSVTVTPDGIVHGLKAGQSASIIASTTVNGVTLADTAAVQIAYGKPVVTTFDVVPPGDSAKIGAGNSNWSFGGYVEGVNVDGMRLYYRSDNARIVGFNNWFGNPAQGELTDYGSLSIPLVGTSIGTTYIHATARVGGVRWHDSVAYRVGNRTMIAYQINVRTRPDGTKGYTLTPNGTLAIGSGGTISFSPADQKYSVTFDHPELVKAVPFSFFNDNVDGNIALWSFDPRTFQNLSRERMVRPGVIQFTIKELGLSGTLNVVDERRCAPHCTTPDTGTP